jgi:hypothetical protein
MPLYKLQKVLLTLHFQLSFGMQHSCEECDLFHLSSNDEPPTNLDPCKKIIIIYYYFQIMRRK